MGLISLPARADVVVLKTGKKFEVEKVWQENGQIWIIFHGMRASLPPSKVARIERKSKSDTGNRDLKKEKCCNIQRKESWGCCGPDPVKLIASMNYRK